MHSKRVDRSTLTIALALLLTVFVLSMVTTAENAFAYKKNQATSQASDCENGQVPEDVGCQNIGSSIQGDENSVAITAQQTFPEVGPTTLPPSSPACEDCIIQLLEQEGLASELAADLGLEAQDDEQAIMDVCEALLSGEVSIAEFSNVLPGLIPQEIAVQIIGCVEDLL